VTYAPWPYACEKTRYSFLTVLTCLKALLPCLKSHCIVLREYAVCIVCIVFIVLHILCSNVRSYNCNVNACKKKFKLIVTCLIIYKCYTSTACDTFEPFEITDTRFSFVCALAWHMPNQTARNCGGIYEWTVFDCKQMVSNASCVTK
jgi:hypothetical protein